MYHLFISFFRFFFFFFFFFTHGDKTTRLKTLHYQGTCSCRAECKRHAPFKGVTGSCDA